MYCLEIIKSESYQKPAKIKDNHNRDSSFVQSKAGFVIHSGIHRSTAFISAVDHPEGWHAANYWFRQGQAAVNGFIEATENDLSLDSCEQNAIAKALPDWTFRRIKGTGKAGSLQVSATRKSGRLNETVSALTWRLLHSKLI